jgi:hypothetical protein
LTTSSHLSTPNVSQMNEAMETLIQPSMMIAEASLLLHLPHRCSCFQCNTLLVQSGCRMWLCRQ